MLKHLSSLCLNASTYLYSSFLTHPFQGSTPRLARNGRCGGFIAYYSSHSNLSGGDSIRRIVGIAVWMCSAHSSSLNKLASQAPGAQSSCGGGLVAFFSGFG